MDPRKVIVANSSQRWNKCHFNKQHASILHYFNQGVVFLLPLIRDRKISGIHVWKKHMKKVEIIIMSQLKVKCYYSKILV